MKGRAIVEACSKVAFASNRIKSTVFLREIPDPCQPGLALDAVKACLEIP
jgi:hypothetical protein